MPIQFETKNQEIIDAVQLFLKEWNSDSEFISTNTSGSTGKPKTIQLRKEHMLISAKATCDFLDLNEGDSALLCLNPSTIGGKMMIVRSIERNLNLTIVEPSSNPLGNLESKFDFCAMVPYQVQNSLIEIDQIKKIIIGGAPSSSELKKSLNQKSCKAFQTFGMTETISHFALADLANDNLVYQTLPGVNISTENGNLVVDYPAIGVTQLQTNDTVNILSEDEFVWLGRTDFVINSGGVKLHPEVIESKLSELITTPFFLTGISDEKWGEKLVLCIQSDTDSIHKKSDFSKLDSYEVPKEIWRFSKFIETESGKINRVKTIEQKPDEVQIL